MSNRLKLLRQYKLWPVLLMLVLVGFVVYWAVAASHKNVEIHLSIPVTTISKDKFLIVNGEFRNTTNRIVNTSWGLCSQMLAYYVDNKIIHREGYEGSCLIGPDVLGPGEVSRQTFTIDPTQLNTGRHSFQVLFEDDMLSNRISFNLTEAADIGSCYNLIDYASPLCSQIRLRANIWGGDNRPRCRLYRDYLHANTPLKPIASISSIDCDDVSRSGPNVIVNVPSGDPDQWVLKLSEQFAAPRLPRDYGTAGLITYPN